MGTNYFFLKIKKKIIHENIRDRQSKAKSQSSRTKPRLLAAPPIFIVGM